MVYLVVEKLFRYIRSLIFMAEFKYILSIVSKKNRMNFKNCAYYVKDEARFGGKII